MDRWSSFYSPGDALMTFNRTEARGQCNRSLAPLLALRNDDERVHGRNNETADACTRAVEEDVVII